MWSCWEIILFAFLEDLPPMNTSLFVGLSNTWLGWRKPYTILWTKHQTQQKDRTSVSSTQLVKRNTTHLTLL